MSAVYRVVLKLSYLAVGWWTGPDFSTVGVYVLNESLCGRRSPTMPDNARNARLAKWMGWIDNGKFWECPSHYRDNPPSYDTDPAAALELLGWLAKKGWLSTNTQTSQSAVCRFRRLDVECIGYGEGPPLIAVPAAIAKAAEAVRELEEGE